MKKTIALLLALMMLMSLCACGGKNTSGADDGNKKTENTGKGKDSSENEKVELLYACHPESEKDILSVLSYRNEYTDGYINGMAVSTSTAMAEEAAMPSAVSDKNDVASSDFAGGLGGGDDESVEYSGTNVQVKGVDEADVVKTDGEYIYVLNGSEFTVFKADGENTLQLGTVIIGESSYYDNGKKYGEGHVYSSVYKSPSELFLCGNTAVIISEYSGFEETENSGSYNYKSENYTVIDYIDVSNKDILSKITTVKQDGSYKSSRLLDGKIYVITGYNVWNYDEDDPETYIPRVYNGGEYCIMPIDDIYILPGRNCQSYTVVSSYGTDAPGEVKSTAYLGRSDDIYMSLDNLYISASEWKSSEKELPKESVYKVTEIKENYETYICRFDLESLDMTGDAAIPGRLDDRFSMDEYEGRLRVVTTSETYTYKRYDDEEYGFTNYDRSSSDSASFSGLYILSDNMSIMGKLENLAEGERIYSARFDGNIAYFCTFKQVDPLFAVDCSNPVSPKVLSALKISGFSDYLHSWTETKLFGAGFEADAETGRTNYLKLVMFDVSDKANVTAENTYTIDGCYYSSALYNVKGFLVDGSKNIISFAGDGNYYVFSYDDAEGFRLLANVSLDDYYWQSRSLYIGDYLYIIGQSSVFVLSMQSWEIVETVPIAKG